MNNLIKIPCLPEYSVNKCLIGSKYIDEINELKEQIGIKQSISEYVEEDKFLESLDEMVELAFDDQCTGANPRYPLMSEIKEMYLKAYYGK